MTKIIYREFYDYPRIVIFNYKKNQYLLDSPFDDNIDDYHDNYQIYLMGKIPDKIINGSWENILKFKKAYLGQIPISEVQFDSTTRKEINPNFIDKYVNKNT